MDHSVGAAVWSTEFQTHVCLPYHITIFTSELYAILLELTYSIQSTHENILILSDSLLALNALKTHNTGDNPIQGNIVNKLHICHKKVLLMWVPGHVGISGNDHTDALAKQASVLKDIEALPWELKSCVAMMKLTLQQTWQNTWNTTHIHNKFKSHISHWDTAHRHNRKEETILARLHLNTT